MITLIILLAAFQTVGLVEVVKNVWTTMPSKVKTYLMPVVAAACMVLDYFGIMKSVPVVDIIAGFLTVVAVAQVGYETIVKLLKAAAEWLGNKVKELIKKGN